MVFSHVSSVDIQEIRLVCSRFRDRAWPAFGSQIRYSSFDMRSIQSMTNIRAISEHVDLVPHVTSLSFCVGYIAPDYPGGQYDEDIDEMVDPEDYLDKNLLYEFMVTSSLQNYWFDDVW